MGVELVGAVYGYGVYTNYPDRFSHSSGRNSPTSQSVAVWCTGLHNSGVGIMDSRLPLQGGRTASVFGDRVVPSDRPIARAAPVSKQLAS